MQSFVEMKIPAKPEFVGVVRLTVSGLANRLGFHFEDIEDLKIAVSEAITNTVQHAYDNDEGEVTIGFGMYGDRLEAIVTDRGGSFSVKDTLNRTNPNCQNTQIENMKEGGFGLYLIEALMDKVEIFNDRGVTVIMTKYLHRDEVGHNDNQISSTT